MEKFERRDIIKLAGGAVAGSAVGTLFSGAPFLAFQWLVEWTQDQHVPGSGAEQYLEGMCQACSNGCNISVRMIGERAVKVETSNSGCPIGQAALQMLYHPERIKKPLKRVGKKGAGRFEEVSWNDAVKDIAGRIDALRSTNKAHSIAAINGTNKNLSGQLLERLIKSCGSANCYSEPSFNSLSAAVVNLTQNQNGSIYYDFENADYILSFGARLIEGWGDAGRMNKAFAGWKTKGSRFVQVDTLCTRSAAAADKWVAIKAGTEAVLAMGIANYLIQMGKRSGAANFAQWSQIIINDYTPERVSQITGVSQDRIKELAQEFASAKNPIAVAGKGAAGVSASSVEIAAIQGLNSLANSLGRRGGVSVMVTPGLGEAALDAQAAESIKKSKASPGLDDYIKGNERPELIFINEANPVHRSVYGKVLASKLEKAPMVVSFSSMLNDTDMYADYVLPTITTLEMSTVKTKEVVAPRNKAIHAGDIILMIAKGAKGLQSSFNWNSYKELLAISGRTEIRAVANFSFPVDLFKNYLGSISRKMEAKEYPLALIPYEIQLVGDGNGLALPYVLKGIDNFTLVGSKLYVLINPETANKYGVSEGSSIDIKSQKGEIGSVKVHLTKTTAPDVIAIPIGFGHTSFTKYAEDKGVNPKQIMSDEIDPISGTADWWFTRVKIS